MFADLDGVITIPAAIVEEVVRLATDKVSRENHSREELQKGAYLRTVYDKYGRALSRLAMIVDVHTHVWERPAHIAERSSQDARITAGNPDLEIAVDLDAHWAAMAPVDRAIVLGFRARHVGVLVPNEYVAAYVDRASREADRLLLGGPAGCGCGRAAGARGPELGLRGLKVAPIYQNIHPVGPAVRAR